MTRTRIFLLALMPLLLLSLTIIPTNSMVDPISKVPDYWPTNNWQTSTPEDQGMASIFLTALDDYIDEAYLGNPIKSTLVIKNGYLVHETYYDPSYGMGMNDTRNIYSCTKSVTSTLIGMAISQGHLSIDDYLIDFFSNLTIDNLDSRKRAITVEHLLTMWDESSLPYQHPDNDWRRMTTSDNWVEFVINRPMEYAPGEAWVYNTGGSHLLSAILTQATNMTALAFTEAHLFGPLGINDYTWPDDRQGYNNGGSSLELRPRDMAKLGFLYLNNGTWDGEQILPAEWVETASRPHVTFSPNRGYGYQWWTHTPDTFPLTPCFSARGYLGQLIYVFPDLDMVVVFTSDSNIIEPNHYLENFILPATGHFPIPEGPSDEDLLIIIVLATATTIIVIVTVFSVYRYYRRKNPVPEN
ncbi:MAG: serine hydrolase domain-containing protein [Candidatus Hermodarchaeia archaeon]|jgi:CubicO group peptidase (beta-lactamase class C family)